jgi:multidrug efflux system membrane fusion protein
MGHENHRGTQPHGERLGSSSETHNPVHPEQEAGGASAQNNRPRQRKWWGKRFWVVVAVLVVLAIFLVPHFTRSHAAAAANGGVRQAPAAITVGQSKSGDINIYVDALGTVTPIYTDTVYSQITGQIMAVHYHQGEMVHAGDPLIDIDPRLYQATLTQAEGTLQHDAGLLAQARMDLKRYQAAYARNAVAKQVLDDQAQAVIQYEGTVKADRGTVAYDRVQLDYCHIVAPINGRVGLRLVDPGNTVFAGSGATLIVITQLQPITVVFNVAEDDLPQVEAQLGAGGKLTVDAFDRADERQIESGTLTSVDNEVDTTTGTVKFRARFPNTNLSLFPNQFVNARLRVQTLHNATLVPSAAVQHNGTNAFVYIVKPDNTVAVQPITTLTDDDQVTAVQGVSPGVKLATSGFDRLENGAQVLARGQTQSQKSSRDHAGNAAPGGS